MKFKQNDPVLIHSLGPKYGDQTFAGKICGLSIDWGDSPATIWIVESPTLCELDDYGFTHAAIAQACIRLDEVNALYIIS